VTPQQFLEQVVPAGLIVIATLKGRGFKHYVCENSVQAANQAAGIDAAQQECYFGLGALKEKRVHNAVKDKWEVRVGHNIRALKSFFIDFDVAADDETKYASQADAVAACKAFCKATNFPAPMLVSSGGGLHAYWPLTEELEADLWRIHAAKFKNGLLTFGIKFDTSRTADASSVLRVPGTNNYKKDTPRPVTVIKEVASYSQRLMLEAIDKLPQDPSLGTPKLKAVSDIPGAPVSLAAIPSNTEYVPQEPANFKLIMMNCPQIQKLALAGGNVPEPFWYAGLGIVKFCENPKKVAAFLSNKHPDYSEAATQVKLDQWSDKGPVTCSRLADQNIGGCDSCAYKGKVTTPLQVGRVTKEAAPPVVEIENAEGEWVEVTIPNPPWPYTRRASGGIVVRSKGDDGVEGAPITVHDYDMYPVRRIYSERVGQESTIWRVNQPIVGWQEIHIEQASLADARSLHAALMGKGIYVPPSRLKLMVGFMIAYITELQKKTPVEKVSSKMAWQEGNASFVLDTKEYHTDGKISSHLLSPELKQEMPGLHSKGTLEGWKEAIQFYNNPGYEAHRFLLYASFGSPLFHMTGHKGAILSATGKPGTGKSTTLQAIASVWGHPQQLIVNGTKSGTTQNALMTLLSRYNNLPFPLDEITKLEPRVVGELCLSVSQGTGKIRSTRTGSLSSLVEAWSLLMITTANTDLYVTLAGDRRDASAEAMRALQIPISLPGVHTKAEADHFINVSLQEHYGHAGHAFAQYIAPNYAAVKTLMLQVTNMVDAKGKIQSGERFWSAIIAACATGAFVARQIGLLDGFPIEADCKWMVQQINHIRSNIREQMSSPRELLSEFLEQHVDETLAVSKLHNTNIKPTVDIMPHGALTIRHETENGVAYIVRNSLRMYCNAIGANFTDMQETLEREGILLDRSAQKVLGADTKFGKGQSRCWKIDMRKLSE
jgi:intracellular sulfur oxidation DsrE/DsrF family protein